MKNTIIDNRKINERLIYKELKNGLKVFLMPKKNYVKKYAIFATNYGSIDNSFIPVNEDSAIKVPEGIAHFLEHKLFEEPYGNIMDMFSKLGSYVNAYTNFNQTAYLFSCTDRFYENLDLLVKFVQNPYFTKENVEKEKGIIEQEIKMYDDDPNWKVFFNCLKIMYHEHPVKIDIAGTVESIKQIDKDMLYKCYNTFYNPQNMVLFITGDIEFDKALEIIECNKNEKEIFDNQTNIKRIYPDEPIKIKNDYIEEDMGGSIPIFTIGYKDIDLGFDGKELIYKEIMTNILLEMLFGESSEFYQKLYEKGLINNSFSAQYIGQKNYGHSILIGESENPAKVFDEINKYVFDIKKRGLNDEDFNRIKKKILGNFIINFNSLEYISTQFVTYYFNNFSILDYLDLVENASIEDIKDRFYNHFKSDNCCLSIIK